MSDDEKQTCPRRMDELGPWKRELDLDRWRTDRWEDTQEAADKVRAEFSAKYPGGSMGNPYWEWGPQPRTCSFCGGIHPDDVVRLIDEGWRVDPTDKSYKRYLEPPYDGTREGGLIPPVKIYVQHFNREQIEAFNRAIDRRHS